MRATVTVGTATELMEAGTTQNLDQRRGTGGAVLSADGQAAQGIKETMTEAPDHRGIAAESIIAIETREVLPPQTDTGSTLELAPEVGRGNAGAWSRRKRGGQMEQRAVERKL